MLLVSPCLTPIITQVARLFLVSDVLHNSGAGVRHASSYRRRLEAVLPDVFESLAETYRTVEGRMAQGALRRHVLRVLRVWRDRFVFSDDFLNGLQVCTRLTALHHSPPHCMDSFTTLLQCVDSLSTLGFILQCMDSLSTLGFIIHLTAVQ
jgi:CID domain